MVDYTKDLIFNKPGSAEAPNEALAVEAFLNGTYTFLGYLNVVKDLDPTGISSLVSYGLNITTAVTVSYYAKQEHKKLHKLNAAMMGTDSTLNFVNSSIGILKSNLLAASIPGNAAALGAASPFIAFGAAALAWTAFVVSAHRLLHATKKCNPQSLMEHNLDKVRKLKKRLAQITDANGGQDTDETRILAQKIANSTTKAVALAKHIITVAKSKQRQGEHDSITYHNIVDHTVTLFQDAGLKNHAHTIRDSLPTKTEQRLVNVVLDRQHAKVVKHGINTTAAFMVATGLSIIAVATLSVVSLGTAPIIAAAALVFAAVAIKTFQAYKQYRNNKKEQALKNEQLGKEKDELIAKIEDRHMTNIDTFKTHKTFATKEGISYEFADYPQLQIAFMQMGERETRLYRMAYEYHEKTLYNRYGNSGETEAIAFKRELDFYETLRKLPEKRREQLFAEILDKNILAAKLQTDDPKFSVKISDQNKEAMLTASLQGKEPEAGKYHPEFFKEQPQEPTEKPSKEKAEEIRQEDAFRL